MKVDPKIKKSKPTKKRSNKRKAPLWFVCLMAAFLALIWVKSDSLGKRVKNFRIHEDMIDFFLKDVEATRIYREAKVEVDNFYYAPEIDDFAALRPDQSEQEKHLNFGVSLDQAGEEERISQDLGLGSQKANQMLPDEIINTRLLYRQEFEVYQEQVEKAYVQAFQQNALRNGYKVDVDNNMLVKRVQKVQPPAGYNNY